MNQIFDWLASTPLSWGYWAAIGLGVFVLSFLFTYFLLWMKGDRP